MPLPPPARNQGQKSLKSRTNARCADARTSHNVTEVTTEHGDLTAVPGCLHGQTRGTEDGTASRAALQFPSDARKEE
ncbi:hypothetical protein MBOU_34200 [Mycobacterium bourgelatii]|uniref:Uncharacterized protein n=1 Tax=Mycobacterium bourgelatii TaxID=1273442 RepID=A0A7I9YRT9_MYCBU|nr:hypothetical protein MBOU_34200 [Mycobacterium bourgelatii]